MTDKSKALWAVIDARDASVTSLQKVLAEQQIGLTAKESVIQSLDKAARASEVRDRQLVQGIEEKEAVIQAQHEALEKAEHNQRQLVQGIEEKEAVIQAQHEALAKAEHNQHQLVQGIEEKEGVIQTQHEALEQAGHHQRLLATGLEEKEGVIQTQHEALEQAGHHQRLLATGLEEKERVIQTQHEALEQAGHHQRLLATGLEEKEGVIQTQHEALEQAENNRRVLAAGLEEKEADIEQLGKVVAAYRSDFAAWGFVIRPLNRMLSAARVVTHRSRNILAPRLGNLNQHAPRELRLPAHYARSAQVAQPPRISIVTPSFNQAGFIERTINSVLAQSYPNLEYRVQDGGSEDGTVEILERYAGRLAGWESHADSGRAQAVNLGFARTSGEIMAWLHSDDIMLPGALAFVAAYFNQHPGIDVVYGHRILIDENDQQIGRWVMPAHDDKVLSWADYVPQETLFWRRSIWDKVGGEVDESIRFAVDWDLLLRFRAARAKFQRLPRFLGASRVHPHQKASAAVADIGRQEMARIRARALGHEVSDAEINKAILPYMRRHVAADLRYRIMNKLR